MRRQGFWSWLWQTPACSYTEFIAGIFLGIGSMALTITLAEMSLWFLFGMALVPVGVVISAHGYWREFGAH